MSSDNGVYIVKFTDGYRVAYAQAIENVEYGYWHEKDAKVLQAIRISYFKDSPVFQTREEAWSYAGQESLKYDLLEYGVSQLADFDHPLFGEFKTAEEAEKYLDDFFDRGDQ